MERELRSPLPFARAARGAATRPEGDTITYATLDAFLRGIEGRAYRLALLAVRDRDDALDIVQDAMIRLARRYGTRPPAEWPPLFHRILQNLIRDAARRRRFRGRLFDRFGGRDGEPSPIDEAEDPNARTPCEHLAAGDAVAELDRALEELPPRQREAFTLRCLEGLDVAATSAAMGCTEGSVKTHYSRAVHRLRDRLRAHLGGTDDGSE